MIRPAADMALAQSRRRLFLDRLRREIAPSLPPGPLGLAVSGGGDSLAMLLAFAELAPDFGWQLQAATVDHGLRAEAAAEAQGVAQLCAEHGVPHQILAWQPAQPLSGNLMDAARRARYQLLAGWGQGPRRVAVAHTADDQAETLLMGLSRAAGLDGLCGMRPAWDQGGVRFLRPLLAVTRADLRRFLMDSDQIWVEDPTNSDPAFDRVKARQALAGLRGMGITADRLARVARNLAGVQSDLRAMLAEVAPRVICEKDGALGFRRAALAGLPDALTRRLLQLALLWLSGRDYPPRADALARFMDALRAGRRATLWGCALWPAQDMVWLVREPRALGPQVPLGQLWDGRWQVSGPGPGVVRALGAEGLAQVPEWQGRGVLRAAALVSPAVWDENHLLAAPVLQFGKDFTATLTAGFGLFLLSH